VDKPSKCASSEAKRTAAVLEEETGEGSGSDSGRDLRKSRECKEKTRRNI
jgi:hypothetical protein